MFLIIECRLNKKEEVLFVTKKWLKKNIPDLDWSRVFDIDDMTGSVAIGDSYFYDKEGSNELKDGTHEYNIAFCENEIFLMELYIMLTEIENKNGLSEIGIENFRINDGSQFGYRKKLEYAKSDLAYCITELEQLQGVIL